MRGTIHINRSGALVREGTAPRAVTAAGRAVAAAAVLPPHAEISVDVAQCIVESDCDDCADDKGCHNDPSVSRFQDTTSTWQMQALPGCQHLSLSVFQMDADAVHGSGKAEHGADLVDEQ